MNMMYEFTCQHCGVDNVVGITCTESAADVSMFMPPTLNFCPNCGKGAVGTECKTTDLDAWEHGATRHLENGARVLAIKHCRTVTGWDLRTAKAAVEQLPAYIKLKEDSALKLNEALV